MTTGNKVIVATLLAEKGKKWEETQQCIGSYDGSIVFLPRDVRAGDIVRVELTPVSEKLDARGKVMYSARVAPVILPSQTRRAVVNEAKLLRSCHVFDQPAALALLRVRFGVELDAWKKYSHYFFEQSGRVYGSNLPPAVLYLCEGFAIATPHELVQLLIWLIDHRCFSRVEEDKKMGRRWSSIPQVSNELLIELQKRVAAGELVLAEEVVGVVNGKVEIPSLVDALWRATKWPDLQCPDFESGAEVPDIVEHSYGKDPNGETLTGFAVVGLTGAKWFRLRTEAEVALAKAQEELLQKRQIWQLREQLKPQIEELNERRRRVSLIEIICEREKFKVWSSFYDYTEENLTRFMDETKREEEKFVREEAEAARRRAAEEVRQIEEAAQAKIREEAAAERKREEERRGAVILKGRQRIHEVNRRRLAVGWKPLLVSDDGFVLHETLIRFDDGDGLRRAETEVESEEERQEALKGADVDTMRALLARHFNSGKK